MVKRSNIEVSLQVFESELVLGIRNEFLKLAKGDESKFISRHSGSYTAAKYSDMHTDKLERLEKDVIALREKLGISIEDWPINLLTEYVQRHRSGHSEKYIARTIVERNNWGDTV